MMNHDKNPTLIQSGPGPTQAEVGPDWTAVDAASLSMGTLTREINLRQKPNWLLRKLMSALETQRMGKKLGWSRPWNKYGLNIFRSHTHDKTRDADLYRFMNEALDRWLIALPALYREFLESLRRDPAAMAFTFYHNNRDGGETFEGLTLSLGRKVPGDKTKRDRLDLILEDRCVDGKVDGKVDRVRVFLNPWSEYAGGKMLTREWSAGDTPNGPEFQRLYELCLNAYHTWKELPERQWEHWSVRYIDYFGPRSFLPEGTSFT